MTLAVVLRWLKARGTKKQIQELDRYGIVAARPFGVAPRWVGSHALWELSSPDVRKRLPTKSR